MQGLHVKCIIMQSDMSQNLKVSTIFHKILDYQNYLKIQSAVTGFHHMPVDEEMYDAILTGVPH
jgi:hypothetical protein